MTRLDTSRRSGVIVGSHDIPGYDSPQLQLSLPILFSGRRGPCCRCRARARAEAGGGGGGRGGYGLASGSGFDGGQDGSSSIRGVFAGGARHGCRSMILVWYPETDSRGWGML